MLDALVLQNGYLSTWQFSLGDIFLVLQLGTLQLALKIRIERIEH